MADPATIEANKAFQLALKHDAAGNTAGAIKWATKSLSISASAQARDLLQRLQTTGASGAGAGSSSAGASTSSSSASAAAGADGLRQRGATQGSSAANGKGKAPEAEPKTERAYTAEQLAVVKRIRKAGGDFYAVLGVEKTVDDNGIKKAYRKVCCSGVSLASIFLAFGVCGLTDWCSRI